MTTIRIGTRSSRLALWQANRVREELEGIGVTVEIVPVKTIGDKDHSGPIAQLGAQGVFTREIQNALLDGRVDLAVHSLKDLPTEPTEGLHFAATLKRGDVADVFISRRFSSLDKLPDGAKLGTGSLRRRCQLLHYLKGRSVTVEDIRGNVETRLRKLDDGDYDGIVLAAAGLIRLGQTDRITEEGRLNPTEFYPAVGQGALGLETRINDDATNALLRRVNDSETFLAVLAERRMLLELHGGCIAPIGAMTRWGESRLVLNGRILSLDGMEQFDATSETEIPTTLSEAEAVVRAEALGKEVAQQLIDSGADQVIEKINQFRNRNRF